MAEKVHFVMASRYSYDYICVIDFEATCIEGGDKEFYPHEIIEFPAVLIDINNLAIVSTFHSFVRPVVNPQLSNFCKNLTGVTQVSVDTAETFPYVLSRFLDWIKDSLGEGESFVILTDGSWDINKFLNLQCHISHVDFPSWAYDWIDVKRSYMYHNKNADKVRLMDMLQAYDLKFEGRLHSGKDDTYNIAQLALAMLRKGCELIANSSLSPASTDYLKRKMSAYLREKQKQKQKQKNRSKKLVHKETTQPRNSREASTMDIDPELIGCEHVLLNHKRNNI